MSWIAEEQARRDKIDRQANIIAGVVVTVGVLMLFAAIFGLRLWIAEGYVPCIFAEDIGTCVAIHEGLDK